MRKKLLNAFCGVLLITITSGCKDTDDLINEYEEALCLGNTELADNYYQRISSKELEPSQTAKMEAIARRKESLHRREQSINNIVNAANEMIDITCNKLGDESRLEKTVESYDKATDEMFEAYDNALSTYLDQND